MMDFEWALKIINHLTNGLANAQYDGIIVKRLEASNTLDEGRTTNQTHIAISGEQMDIFPYLAADGYFNPEYQERDEQLKKYFIAKIPLNLYQKNVRYLEDGDDLQQIPFGDKGYITVRASIVRSRRKKQADQVQLSLITVDDKAFVAFRRLLHTGDYLVILKKKEKIEYDCIGIKGSDESRDGYNLSDLHNKFYKYSTNTEIDIMDIFQLLDNKNDSVSRKTGGANILLYGVPGAGKSYTIRTRYCSDVKYMERVVFHPDYSYSDFTGQILPKVEGETLRYIFTPGPFTKILKKAEEDPGHEYYLVIEEINRGNAPAIFGEIFQLLDRKDESGGYPPDELGESEYGVYNEDVAMAVYGDAGHPVKIPSNLSVLATMNTADQNVFTLDTAFQRRWDMSHIANNIMAADHASELIEGTHISWGIFATVINDMILDSNAEIASSEDKRLGAYFIRKKELSEEKFPEKVLKYLWDDAFKMNKDSVFKTEFKSLEQVIAAYRSDPTDKLARVLKSDVYDKMGSSMKKDEDGSGSEPEE